MKKWIFDEAPPNQYNPGESVLDQIFASSSSLAKEPLQNSIDRITEANNQNQAQGKIEISLMEFSGVKKSELLESINWSSLRDHVAAVSEDGSRKFSTRLKNAISRIEGKDPLFTLVVSDFGTIGLPGSDFEPKNHIYKLTRSAHITDDMQKNRDGSHGLGKGVFWKYSGISTVFFYSLTCKDELATSKEIQPPIKQLGKYELDHRFIGNSTLAFHKIGGQIFTQAGFFGNPETMRNGEAAVSSWGKDKLLDILGVVREESLENAGTSVIVFDYNDPGAEDSQSGSEIIHGISRSCAKWFWPALSAEGKDGEKLLDLKLKHYKNGILADEIEPNLTDFINFIEIFNSSPTESEIGSVGQLAGQDVGVEVPLLREHPSGKKHIDSELSVKVKSIHTASATSENEKELINTAALLRRKTMVVDYEKVNAKIQEGTGIYGIVAAGYARGTSAEDEMLHNFLRDMEPPAHDSWDKYDDKLILYPRGSKKLRTELIKRYRTAIKNICSKEVETKGKDVPALAAMLRFPGRGKTVKKSTIDTSNIRLEKLIADNRIRIKFNLFCNDIPSGDLWRAALKVKVRGASENLEFVAHQEIGDVTSVVSEEVINNELIITIHFENRIEYQVDVNWPNYLPINDKYAIDLITRYIKG